MLASYAVRVESSLGRRYPEPPHPYRDDFQRDRDRIIHARAFRRLENKTQVFTQRLSDHFRTRLTHTIEVAQISRTIAAALNLNETLVETLALVHDIGHPPFGHSGEHALDLAMREHGESFDHNLHALRIVEHFEQRYASHPGLNLTFEVREGIIKHSHDYLPAEHSELAEYLLDQLPPLEAQLIDHTDEIAYNTADLDDGYEARLLKLDDIRREVAIFDRYFRQVEREFSAVNDKLKFNEALKRMLNHLVTDLIENATGCRPRAYRPWKRSGTTPSGWPPSVPKRTKSASRPSSFFRRTSTIVNRCAHKNGMAKRLSKTFFAIGWSTPPVCLSAISARPNPKPGLA
jgi:dGTPase